MQSRRSPAIIFAAIAFSFSGIVGIAEAGPVVHSDGVRQLIERAASDPHLAVQPTTVIIETDSGRVIRAPVSAAGGTLRYSIGRRHEVVIPAGRLSQLISRLPANSLVRFPYPHQALAVTSQGVALTGAGDMQALGNNGAGIKIGIIDLGFAGLSAAQGAGELPANLSVTDYTGTGTGASITARTSPRLPTTWRRARSTTWQK